MADIDLEKIAFLDRVHDVELNPSNRDDREIDSYDHLLKLCSGIPSLDHLSENIDVGQNEITWIDYCCGKNRS